MAVIKPDMISDKVTRKDMLPLSFLKMSPYTGSKRNMNYKLAKTEVSAETEAAAGPDGGKDAAGQGTAPEQEQKEPETRTVLRVLTWFGPYASDATDPSEMETADMEFSDAGIDAAVEYLNRKLEEAEKIKT